MTHSLRVGFSIAGGLAALLVGCGGSSSSTPTAAAMNVHLVDGPISGYQEINLNIQSVEISGDGGWVTLATPNKTVNLLDLVGGVEESLAKGATLPAGHYGQMRLKLGSGNTVKLADGTVQPLTVPSGLQSGVKLVVSFDVAAGTTKDVWIDFDAAHSIQVVAAGASGQYLLRPTVWAYDKVVTGSISGKLTDGATASGLAGARVYAEVIDSTGAPRIARSTVTDSAGAYTLDLLPVGATYYVVSQPVAGTTPTAYDAKASDGCALSAATPTFTWNAGFTASAATGAVSGTLTPVATSAQSDLVVLMQALATPSGGTKTFIVRTDMAVVGTSTETFGFATLPAASYSLQGFRSTLALDGSSTTVASAVQAATVTSGGTVAASLAF